MQVAIYDTPGMRGTRDYETRSQAMRVGATWQHVQECDLLALIVDAEAFSRRNRRKGGGRGSGGGGGRESAAQTRDFRQQVRCPRSTPAVHARRGILVVVALSGVPAASAGSPSTPQTLAFVA